MSSRVVGAGLALVAAALLAVSIATPAVFPAKASLFAGHPTVGGHRRELQDVYAGFYGIELCNTGGDGACMPRELATGFRITAWGALAVTVLLTFSAIGLGVLTLRSDERRKKIAPAMRVLVAGAMAAAALMIIQGPTHAGAIPVGAGMIVYGVGLLSALLGSVIAVRPPPPIKLRVGDRSSPSHTGQPAYGLAGSHGEPAGVVADAGRHAGAPQLRPLYDAGPLQGGTGGLLPVERPALPTAPPAPLPRASISALAGIPTPPPMAAESAALPPPRGRRTSAPPPFPAGAPPALPFSASAPFPPSPGLPPAPFMAPPGAPFPPPGASFPPPGTFAPPAGAPFAPPFPPPPPPAGAPFAPPFPPPPPPPPPTGAPFPPPSAPFPTPAAAPSDESAMSEAAGAPPPISPGAGMSPQAAPSDAPSDDAPRAPRTEVALVPPMPGSDAPATSGPVSVGAEALGSASDDPEAPTVRSGEHQPRPETPLAPPPPPREQRRTAPPPMPAPRDASAASPGRPGRGQPPPRPARDTEAHRSGVRAIVPMPARNAPSPTRPPASSVPPVAAARTAPGPTSPPPSIPPIPALPRRVETEVEAIEEVADVDAIESVDAGAADPVPVAFDDQVSQTNVSAAALEDEPVVDDGEPAAPRATDTAPSGEPVVPAGVAHEAATAPPTATQPAIAPPVAPPTATQPAIAPPVAPPVAPPTATLPAASAFPTTIAGAVPPAPLRSDPPPTADDRAIAKPVKVPISTAPDSLPPPRDTKPASGPSPACPQCESPMAWVEEHLRFYCRSCRMYF